MTNNISFARAIKMPPKSLFRWLAAFNGTHSFFDFLHFMTYAQVFPKHFPS